VQNPEFKPQFYQDQTKTMENQNQGCLKTPGDRDMEHGVTGVI
jgi:hypothetical protein